MNPPRYRIKGASGALANRAFSLDDRLVIGRADDCDVRLDEPDVEPRHCELRANEHGVEIERLAGEVNVNGQQVEQQQLSGGDEIRIGRHRFVLQAPGLRPERVLTADAVRPRRSAAWWLIPAAILGGAAVAWQQGWLQAVLG
ncbi:MAG: FHA domain-containing protein [Xanthomonadales bacterium]|nr:FHA domain-containing protein [Xanthomonadales bacterium]